jgi:protoporphyrinogen oxidase
MEQFKELDTAIIGAGIGGLAAGNFLQKAAKKIHIFEKAGVPGGRIQLLERDGARVDVGTQYFHTNYEETYKLLDEVGLKEQLIPIRPPVKIMRGGRGYLVKHNTLRYKMIPLTSNLKFAKIFLTTLRNFKRIDPYFNAPLPEFEDIELSDYILKKCDKEALEFLVYPIITAFNLSEPEGESLAHFLRITKQFLTSSDTCLPGGMYSFPEKLAARLPVSYNAEIERILVKNNRVTGLRVKLGGKAEIITAKNVVCATPLKELARLLPDLSDEEKSVTRDYVYSQFPLAVFFLKRRLPENHWAFVFSRTEGFKAAFASDAAFKCAQMVPSGNSVVQVWFVGESGHQLVDEPDEVILGQARKEMRRIIPQFENDIDSVEVVRHHTGMSRYKVGIYPRLRKFLETMKRFERLHLVGDYYGHSTIETVVRSARRAVERMQEDVK